MVRWVGATDGSSSPRVLLSPHAAFYSVESERDLRTKAARNIVTWARTGKPDYVVVRGTRRPPVRLI